MFRKNFNEWCLRFINNQRGSALVEVSFVIFPFIMTVLFIAEICRITFISASLDLALAESGRMSSVSYSSENYKSNFEKSLKDKLTSWPLFSRDVKIEQSIKSCSDIDMLIASPARCSSEQHKNNPLALYSVKIEYKPVFFIFPSNFVNNELQRSVVLIQEFQRKDDVF